MSEQQAINNLKKIFLSLEVISDFDLKKLMTISEMVDGQLFLNLLLDTANKLDENELQRILKYIPSKHQALLLTFLKVISKKDPNFKLLRAHESLKNKIINDLEKSYFQEKTLDKVIFECYLNNLSNQELNYIINFLENKEANNFKKDALILIDKVLKKQKEKI